MGGSKNQLNTASILFSSQPCICVATLAKTRSDEGSLTRGSGRTNTGQELWHLAAQGQGTDKHTMYIFSVGRIERSSRNTVADDSVIKIESDHLLKAKC